MASDRIEHALTVDAFPVLKSMIGAGQMALGMVPDQSGPEVVRIWTDRTRALWNEGADGLLYRVDALDGEDQGVDSDRVHTTYGPLTTVWERTPSARPGASG